MSKYKCWVSVPFKKEYLPILNTIKNSLEEEKVTIKFPGVLTETENVSTMIHNIKKEINKCDLLIADMTEFRVGVLTEILWGIENGLPIIVISNAMKSPKELPLWIFDFNNQIGPSSKLNNFEYLIYFSTEDLKDNIKFFANRLLYKAGKVEVLSKTKIRKTEKPINLKECWHNIESYETSAERGKQLEEFTVNLINSITGLVVAYRRYHSDFGELDIIIRNNRNDRPWSDMPFFFPIECKWKDNNKKVGIKEFRDFIFKIENLKQINFGILITNTNFTKDLIKERNRVLARIGILVGLINGRTIYNTFNKEFTPEEVIVSAYEIASIGGK